MVHSTDNKTASLVKVNSNSTIINGDIITTNEEFMPALKQSVIGAFFRAQGIPSFLTDEGVQVKCAKPAIFLRGFEQQLKIPVWKAESEAHAEWKKKAQVAVRAFLVKAQGYVYGDLKEQVRNAALELNVIFDKVPNAVAPANETPTPNA